MPITYYVALPFMLSEEGDLVAGEAKDFQSSSSASRAAQVMTNTCAGAIVFSRTGDPALGEFEPAVILARYGTTPDEVK